MHDCALMRSTFSFIIARNILLSSSSCNNSEQNFADILVQLMAMQDITTASGLPVDNQDEDTPLLPRRTRSWLAMRYGNTRKCVSSKAALLILLWGFVVGLLSGLLINLELYNSRSGSFGISFYGGAVIISCFFPLAGILADIKYGRYKTVVTSLYIVLLAVLPAAAIVAIITSAVLFEWSLALIVVFGVLGGIVIIMLYVGLIGFTANVVQFGMDQLHDSPAEDSTLFIHWYVWTYYASFFSVQVVGNLLYINIPFNASIDFDNYNIISIFFFELIPVIVVMVLAITLYLARGRRRWFLIEPGGLNPYKLVYRVTKFARQHKIPVQRSAFTYCEDELPSGLDLGKEKYGGFFTTEQVEDVKAFYGILKVLFSFGIVFFLDFAADSTAPFLAYHIASAKWGSGYYYHDRLSSILLINGLFYPLMIVVCIPLYLCFLRPFISQYVPGMLKRMGLGMFIILLSLMVSFSMDTAKHFIDHNSTSCIFYNFDRAATLNINPILILIQLTLAALSHMLIYTAVFEFICSQSPHSMKGLLIGVLYAIRGLYQLLAIIPVILFGFVDYPFDAVHHISCGFYYYLTNIVIGVVALLVYTCVAKRYRYRVRDELCNVHQYAENYYSNQQYREEILKTE